MIGWRFALSRRWFGYLGLAVVFAIACVFLARWQLDRRAEAVAEIVRVDTNWDSTPRAVSDVLPDLASYTADDEWIPVSLSGHYLIEDQVLARGRPLNGDAGFEVLVPLLMDNGTVFIVDRGWLPTGNSQDTPDTIPAAPSGEVTVVARLKASEPTVLGRSAPAGQIATIHLPDLAQRVSQPTYTGAYGVLDSETPAPSTRPEALQKPVADEGPHLSYAFQWVAFGIMGFIGLGWAIRQEYRIRNADDPAERARAAERKRRKDAKPRSDAEVEDELLDASR